ncbi:unnamed protein product, partial [Effrenium voratum]
MQPSQWSSVFRHRYCYPERTQEQPMAFCPRFATRFAARAHAMRTTPVLGSSLFRAIGAVNPTPISCMALRSQGLQLLQRFDRLEETGLE